MKLCAVVEIDSMSDVVSKVVLLEPLLLSRIWAGRRIGNCRSRSWEAATGRR